MFTCPFVCFFFFRWTFTCEFSLGDNRVDILDGQSILIATLLVDKDIESNEFRYRCW